MDLNEHLKRQMAFSRATYGPGERTSGVVDHIRKELVEVEESGGEPEEWVDVVILALDGLWRSLEARDAAWNGLSKIACGLIYTKQGRNEQRDWPDWRSAPKDKAIEHVRSAKPAA